VTAEGEATFTMPAKRDRTRKELTRRRPCTGKALKQAAPRQPRLAGQGAAPLPQADTCPPTVPTAGIGLADQVIQILAEAVINLAEKGPQD